MPGPKPSPPRIRQWRGKWCLVYRDPATGKEKRRVCEGESPKARKAELDALLDELGETQHEMRRRGGALAYDTLLVEALDRYLADVAEREKARQANPQSREGLAPKSASGMRHVVKHFKAWLKARGRARIATGEVDRALLQAYFRHAASETTRLGNREVVRSDASTNRYRRDLRAAFRWLDALRPPLLPDYAALAPAFKATATDNDRDVAFSPDALRAFLRTALDREAPGRVIEIERRRSRVVMPNGAVFDGRDESFTQRPPHVSAVPVSRLFLLLALGGMRLGEALALRWQDCDLERGRLTVRASKTGRRRILPLTGAVEGEVAPTLLELLRRWRLEAGDREHVLPHGSLPAPTFPKGAWQRTYAEAGIDRIGPQMLRRNWVSYAASIGIPATVAALWAGHGAAVAEKWYRQQALDREAGASIEGAMGLTEPLRRMLAVENGKVVDTTAHTG